MPLRIMMRFFLLILISKLVISCSPYSQKEYEDSFDVPLLTRNEKLRLSGEYDSLLALNKQYYKKAVEMGYQDGKALCYINLANVNLSMGNYLQTQTFFDRAGKILAKSENNIHKAKYYSEYSQFQIELNRLDQVSESNRKAMDYIKKTDPSPLKNNIMFKIYLKQGQYLALKKQYKEALEYMQKAGKLERFGMADCMIGDYIYMYKNMDSAYRYISGVYNKVNKEKRTDAVALYANTLMGEYYIEMNQNDEAEKALMQALEVDRKTRPVFTNYTKYIYNDLRVLYNKKGDKEKAYYYLKAYTDAKNRSNDAMLKTAHNDLDIFAAEEEKARKAWNKVLIISVTLTLVFVLSGIYVWKVIKKLNQKKGKLKNETEDLKKRMDGFQEKEVIELAKKNDPSFLAVFKEVYPEFIEKILTINPDLENSELIFCAMLKLHFRSKEIANYTSVLHKTVQQKKYRIRKRLNIPPDQDIYDFFDEIR